MAERGMETMTKAEIVATIRDIMGAWEKYRALWIQRFGNDEGFGDWFTEQTKKEAPNA